MIARVINSSRLSSLNAGWPARPWLDGTFSSRMAAYFTNACNASLKDEAFISPLPLNIFIGSPRKICQSYQLNLTVKRGERCLLGFETCVSPNLSVGEVYSTLT